MIENNYYDIAYNELLYLECAIDRPFYNALVAQAQQIAEKMLKSIAEVVCVGIEKLMVSHNLRGLYDVIHREEPSFILDRNKLSTLKDYYYDARYPGDNFISVNEEECYEVVQTMYDVVIMVNAWRKEHGYPIKEVIDKSEFVKNSNTKEAKSF